MLTDKLFERVVKKYGVEEEKVIRMNWLQFKFYDVIFTLLDKVDKLIELF